MHAGARFGYAEARVFAQWVHFGEQRQQVLGKNFQEGYFLQFLAKPGAERAQLGVFGHSRAIGAIYFSF
jgi:hypothetical protein